jgi:ATP-dependent Zn protease
VVLPSDPDLVDILAKNGVDISVSEGEQQGNFVSLLGNLLFPLIAFGGLFFLFRRAQARAQGPASVPARALRRAGAPLAPSKPPGARRLHPCVGGARSQPHLLVRVACRQLTRRAPQNGGGGMGGMGGMGGGPMDFGKSKSKFQEVPETGVKFVDVAVRCKPVFCAFSATSA